MRRRDYKPALAYIRVSTHLQAENGAGLEVQRRAIRDHCRRHRLQLVAVVEDAGLSGSLADRPGLGEIEQALREHRAELVVIHRFDRLARDLVVQEITIARWRRLGGSVVSALEGKAADDPSRKLVRQIMGAVAEYDKQMVVARLRWGRQAKARQGQYAGGGVALGYRATPDGLVVDEAQARTVKRAAQLRRQGAGYRTIAATLAQEGYPTKRGGRWQPNTVRRLLRSAQVQGRVTYGDTAKGKHQALAARVRR